MDPGCTRTLDCDRVGDSDDLLEALRRRDLDALVVRGVYPAERLADVAARLQTDHGFDVTPAHAAGSRDARVSVLGCMIAPTGLAPHGPELAHYQACASRFARSSVTLFEGLEAPASRIASVLSGLGGGCPAAVPHFPDGAAYTPATIRVMPDGCGAPPHRDHNLEVPSYSHLRELCDLDPQFSFYIPLALPDVGGELRVTFDGAPGTVVTSRDLRPGVGDMLVFCGSRFMHEVVPTRGPLSRITLGGFCAHARGRAALHFWS